ncbi:DUF99 family protein [Chlorogloeopsis sp. ULAP02]|uniref:endonuclease dU n=1 Tax=Chlorogloeopsis sp. ULAP02 TaxID=3107926 RepID=UPI00313688DF
MINLPLLAKRLERPCIAVMRRQPNLNKIEKAIHRLPQPEQRLEILRQAGRIYEYPPFYFQVCGAEPQVSAQVLRRLTDCGYGYVLLTLLLLPL